MTDALPVELTTSRLLLRQWRDSDREPWAALGADPVVMEHFPKLLTREESDEFVDRNRDLLARQPYGLWAVQLLGAQAPDPAAFLGFVGLAHPRFTAHFTSPTDPALEVGWRLARQHWGQGYATEAAAATLDHAFSSLGREEVVSFTAVPNVRSQRVMQRLGMWHDEAGDFDHPNVADGSPLKRHVLYRISREQWEASRSRSR